MQESEKRLIKIFHIVDTTNEKYTHDLSINNINKWYFFEQKGLMIWLLDKNLYRPV